MDLPESVAVLGDQFGSLAGKLTTLAVLKAGEQIFRAVGQLGELGQNALVRRRIVVDEEAHHVEPT